MSGHEKYVVVLAEGLSREMHSCKTEEGAEKHAADLIEDSSVDSVAIYELQKTGVRQSSVRWADEKLKQQTLQLETLNGDCLRCG